ncbi:hypothetical protein GCM10022222_67800 [Amycolatopsis ultiminotia]|uniref:Lipoprotein signal peptidase n=1 Tax=Amycolatopsis ultiminotia TaxID=543629 RepID=A0ABP6XXX9_9PSEU
MTTPARHQPTRARIGFAVTAVSLVAIVVAMTHVAGTALADGRSVDLGLLQLRLTFNPGVAFSLGAGLPTWVVLAATALITAGVGFYAWRSAPGTPVPGRIGLAAVLAGALSNLLDRAFNGVVTDYLHTGWFPTFNLADTLITIGAALLILTTLRQPNAPNTTTEQNTGDDRAIG